MPGRSRGCRRTARRSTSFTSRAWNRGRRLFAIARSAGLPEAGQACGQGRPKGLRYGGMRNALAITLLLGGVLSAQQTNPNPPQPPTFRSSVQLIEVDVRVFDKEGRFVTTLTRDDFEIVEEGAPQKVEAMFLVGADQPPV